MAGGDEADVRSRGGGSRSDGRIDELVAAYVDRLNAGQRIDPGSILEEQPSVGPEVLRRLEAFLDLAAAVDDAPRLNAIGDYRLLCRIGRGGMGVVYEAWQGSMDRRVALKVLPPGAADDDRAFQRFLREAKAAGKLSHPSIVGVHAMGLEGETPYYAMELIDGESLARLLARKTEDGRVDAFGGNDNLPVYANRAAEAFAGVAEGLQHAHSRGIVHRDIKPSNLILERGGDGAPDRGRDQGGSVHIPPGREHILQGAVHGRLRILDFGLAHLEGQESLTWSGELVGTPLYMSPEQARARRVAIDHRTDIYSLGATLYEVLTLRPPFRGRDHQDTLSQILLRDPPGPRRINPRIPQDLETIVLKCLRKDPAARYATAEALAQDLRRFTRGDPVEARPEGAWEQLRRRLRRNRVRLAVGLGFALLLALAGVLGWRGERAAREAARERYRPAVLEFAARLAASAASRAQSVALPPGPLSPLSREELRRLLEGGALRSVREVAGELRRLTEELPEERDGHYHLARAQRLLGRDDLARAAVLSALAVDPGFVPAAALLEEIEGPGRSGAGGPGLGELSAGAAEWTRLWLKARRALGSGGASADWPAALQAYDGLLRIARAAGEPYAGLFLEAYLGRGAARLGLEDLEGAIEDFAVARERAPGSLEPALLLGKAYLLAKEEDKTARARSIFESLFLDAPAGRREEAALWIALVHVSLRDPAGTLPWAARIVTAGARARLESYLHLELEDWTAAVASGREAVAAAPGDVTARLLLASALLGRASRRSEATCEERLELIEEVKSLSESEPENQHAGFLLRMALETVRPVLGPQSRSRRTVMTKPTRCLEALVALALALGARPVPAEVQVIRDDFIEDPVWDDGEPLTWGVGQNACCPAQVQEEPGGGICITSLNPPHHGTLATLEVFSGDVRFQAQAQVGSWASLSYGDMFTATGYFCFVVADRSTAGLWRVVNGRGLDQIAGSVDFDPTAGDVILELRTSGGDVEFRAWPERDTRPDAPLLVLHDERYREGVVVLGAGPGAPSCFRWAEITVAPPPPPCDTHCQGLEITQISDSGNNTRATVQAIDDGGDPILYTFAARRGVSFSQEIGPQAEPVADFDLQPGTYSISVSVSDGAECSPEAENAVCKQTYVVPEGPPPGLQRPGDCNQDRKLDISDAVCVLGFLFLGGPERLPCGDGAAIDAANVSLADWQPDGKVDLSDAVGLLQFLFSGGPPHPLGSECAAIAECPETCER
ncbi:MAG: protein kinase [Planctomycetes bacterium]|nr:protein kinase [Planctomycetota bacterium]